MNIYNPLFYHSYEIALQSQSNRDYPLFFTLMFVMICIMFNIFSLLFFFEGLGIIENKRFF